MLLIGISVALAAAALGCSSPDAPDVRTDDFQLTTDERVALSATAAAFQVQSPIWRTLVHQSNHHCLFRNFL